MIVALKGKLVHKEPTFVHVELSSGVTYKVTVSLFTSAELTKEYVDLKITQIFREDAQLLFGFLSSDEQLMFETVIKLNGIGPSTGMAICSTLTPESFSKALFENDVNAFKAVPGIGPKSAKRILVELSDFTLNSNETPAGITHQEAILALESLGFKKERIKKALLKCKESETAALVKEALRKLT